MVVAIIDYGTSNLGSVFRTTELCGFKPKIVSCSQDWEHDFSHVILPGTGTFYEGMKKLEQRNLVPLIQDFVLNKKKPFLGICLGMQLLANYGEEAGGYQGLGFIEGAVIKMPDPGSGLRLPHVGWNDIDLKKPNDIIFNHIKNESNFYFVHSYYFKAKNTENILATTLHGIEFPSIIGSNNIYGAQFHPEKSQKTGLILLKNFLNLG